MNDQIRRLLSLAIVMMMALLAALSYVQFFSAPSLWADGRNVRAVYQQYGRERGQIMLAGSAIAKSEPTNDRFRYQRVYPQGPSYAHITGYFPTALAGAPTGLEGAAAAVLNGVSSSQWTQRVQDLITGHQPRGGVISLTIDPKIQAAAIAALDGRKGAVAALNPATGQILALYSNPSFDPNMLSNNNGVQAQNAWKSISEDPQRPLINRAIGGDLYPPGSIFKIVTATAMLESGQYKSDTIIDAPVQITLPQTTSVLSNYGNFPCGSGKVPLAYAFEKSCNTPFALAAMQLGDDAMLKAAKGYGFEQKLSIPLRVTPSVYPLNPSKAATASAGIGQQNVRVSPLQMAMVAAGVANGGQVMKPYLIEQELSADLQVTSQAKPQVFSQATSAENAATLRDMMVGVVEHGTGTAARIPGVKVAGKTGTAQTAPGKPNTLWFVGFAPVENPKIALALVLEGTESNRSDMTGGTLAAPAAAQILKVGVGQ